MKRTRLKSRSPSKRKHNDLYAKAKAEYKSQLCEAQGRTSEPLCERCGTSEGDQLHHKAGRAGCLLWCKDYFSYLCWECHVGPTGVHFGDKEAAERDGWTIYLDQTARDMVRLAEMPKLYE